MIKKIESLRGDCMGTVQTMKRVDASQDKKMEQIFSVLDEAIDDMENGRVLASAYLRQSHF